MSDTLRTALEELAEKWNNAGFPSKATDLRTILAAHPTDTVTEWAVKFWDTGDIVLYDNEQDANTDANEEACDYLMRRNVGTWERAL